MQNNILIGKRHGKKYDGFDYDNLSSSILKRMWAVAEYIITKQPQMVSLVCMSNDGVKSVPEDDHV